MCFDVSAEAFGYSLKRHSRSLFLQPQVTPEPARSTRRLRLSFSLNDVNQQYQTTKAQKTPGSPLGHPADRQLVSAAQSYRHATPQRRAPQ